MKYCLVLLLLFPGLWSLRAQSAQDPTVLSESKIDSVRLYLDGAEVFRSENLVLQPGRNYFVFTGLSSKLYPNSLQFTSGSDQVRVLSINSKTNFLERRTESKRVQTLKDSVELVRLRIGEVSDQLEAYGQEKDLLQQNKSFKGEDKTLTIAELQATADFYRDRNLQINTAVSKRKRELVDLNRRLFDLKLMLTELNEGQTPTAEVSLVIEADRAMRTDLQLRYVVADAGWGAVYDLESGELSEPVRLRYRARAFNNTGVDWNDVTLTVTTLDPLQSAVQPQLTVWNLNDYSTSQLDNIANLGYGNIGLSGNVQGNFYDQIQQTKANEMAQRGQYWKKVMGDDFNGEIDYETDLYRRVRERELSERTVRREQVVVPEFNIDFPIAGPVTIPSELKPYYLDIDVYDLQVSYKYYAVPKLDKDAFLIAQIVGWEDLDLINGPVNVYNGRRFIGQSAIDIRTLSDTLSVSMGRDKDVTVTRVKVKGKSRRMLLGTTRKASIAYNISVANHKSQPIQIEVYDQLPIATDKEIIITADELSGGLLEEKTGEVRWDISLGAGENTTREFGYTIKYPKDKYPQFKSAPPSRGTRSLYQNNI